MLTKYVPGFKLWLTTPPAESYFGDGKGKALLKIYSAFRKDVKKAIEKSFQIYFEFYQQEKSTTTTKGKVFLG